MTAYWRITHTRTGSTGKFMGLRAGLHACLVRAVCNLPSLQPLLLPQLVGQLAACRWNDPLQAAWLSSTVPDLVDAVQCAGTPLGESTASIVASGLGYSALDWSTCQAAQTFSILSNLINIAVDLTQRSTVGLDLWNCLASSVAAARLPSPADLVFI